MFRLLFFCLALLWTAEAVHGQKVVEESEEYEARSADISKLAYEDFLLESTTATTSDDMTTTLKPVVYTTAMKYGYATAAVTIITALAFIGILAIPALGSRFYVIAMQCFVSLGIGSLTGDALLHLIPYALGIGEDPASANPDENDYLWKLCACIGGIWIMFLFEKCMRMAGGGHDHNHSHVHTNQHTYQLEPMGNESSVTSFSTKDVTNTNPQVETNGNAVDLEAIENKEESPNKNEKDENKAITYFGIPIMGWMIFTGDALHNFGDGLALGVAFSESWVTGVGTSLAIFCHELPHEFSDFALYLNCGISKVKSLLLNFAAACCCYIGLYIGLAISNDVEIRKWLLSVIAGIFLYVAFVDVFPELWNEDKKRPLLTLFVQNIGMLVGWALLLVIAVFEEDLENSIG